MTETTVKITPPEIPEAYRQDQDPLKGRRAYDPVLEATPLTPGENIAILGPTGIGKTTLAVEVLFSAVQAAINSTDNDWKPKYIYSNVMIYDGNPFYSSPTLVNGSKIPHRSLRVTRTLDQILKCRDGILLWDEPSKMLPARDFGSYRNQFFAKLAGDFRKHKVVLIYTDQYSKGVDVFVRTNVRWIFAPKLFKDSSFFNYGAYVNFEAYIQDLLRVGRPGDTPQNFVAMETIIPTQRLWEYFDTEQVIPIIQLKPTPTQAKKQAVKILKWIHAKTPYDADQLGANSLKLNKLATRWNLETHTVPLNRATMTMIVGYLEDLAYLQLQDVTKVRKTMEKQKT